MTFVRIGLSCSQRVRRGVLPTIDELEGWMTTGQAARRIGRSREGTLTLARDRRLRAVYVGGRYGRGVWIYDPAGVEAFRRERGEGDAR